MSILSHEEFSAEDFHERWRRARLAAIRSAAGLEAPAQDDEIALLGRVPAEKRDSVLRAVFDNSRKLGLSAVRSFGLVWEPSDVAEVLGAVPSPCVRGAWNSRPEAWVLRRGGCDAVAAVGPLLCDYWREAVDGLVMGASETGRFARHGSRGHGDAECVDVVFDESTRSGKEGSRYGSVPEKLRTGLREVGERFAGMGATLTLEGLSEGILYYRLESAKGPLCGAGGRMMHESLAREVKGRFPGLGLADASPLAVYGEGTK